MPQSALPTLSASLLIYTSPPSLPDRSPTLPTPAHTNPSPTSSATLPSRLKIPNSNSKLWMNRRYLHAGKAPRNGKDRKGKDPSLHDRSIPKTAKPGPQNSPQILVLL